MASLSPLSAAQIDSLLQTSFAANLDPKYGPVNLAQGSPMAALLKAFRDAGFVWQDQAQTISNFDRLASATGPDVDSFVQPFGITRLPGTYATTSVVLGTSSPVASAVQIPVGIIVQRSSDGQQYVVTADASQSGFSGGFYNIPVGSNAVTATVTCLTEGSIGNCDAGAINALYGGAGAPIVNGVSTVTNALAVQNGIDAESDAALKSRFQIQGGLPKYGVRAAILSAVAGTQSGLIYQYGDVKNPDGSYHAAYFTVVVNNAGSSTGPSPALLSAVSSAVDAVRSGGVEFTVVGPSLVPVTISASLSVLAGFVQSDVDAAAKLAIQTYVNGIGMNADGSNTTVSYAKITALLLGVTGVSNVVSGTLLLNGGTSDLTAGFGQQFVASSSSVFS